MFDEPNDPFELVRRNKIGFVTDMWAMDHLFKVAVLLGKHSFHVFSHLKDALISIVLILKNGLKDSVKSRLRNSESPGLFLSLLDMKSVVDV